MGWKSAYEYDSMVVAELKAILKQRKLRRGGPKKELVSRLKVDDLEQSVMVENHREKVR